MRSVGDAVQFILPSFLFSSSPSNVKIVVVVAVMVIFPIFAKIIVAIIFFIKISPHLRMVQLAIYALELCL